MANTGKDQEAHAHPSSTKDQARATAELLNHPKARECTNHVDRSQDNLDNERVVHSGGTKDDCSVVEKEIRTCQLLEGHESNPKQRPVCHARTSEDLIPWAIASGFFFVQLLLHLPGFLGHRRMVLRNAKVLAHDLSCFCLPILAKHVFWAFGHEDHADAQDERPEEADAHGDAPGSRGLDAFRAKVNDIGNQNANRNEQLEEP